MPSVAHRHKRQLQAPITSYFDRADGDDYIASTALFDAPIAPLPALPPTVQASLLSVGMRVRKSVPEGYKTHHKASPHSTRPALLLHEAADTAGDLYQPTTRPAELVPFCGLHKTGGYAAQPSPGFFRPPTSFFFRPDLAGAHGAALDDGEPGLFFPSSSNSSQGSAASMLSADAMPTTATLPVRAHKRPFQDDFDDFEEEEGEEDDDDDGNAGLGHYSQAPTIPNTDYTLPPPSISPAPPADDPSISPRSRYPISHTSMPDFSLLTAGRPVARPRTRRKGSARTGAGLGLVALRRGAVQEGVGGDFEEAEFLRGWDGGGGEGGDVGGVGEVEMGGV